jgi:hypothetical protein
MSNLIPLDHAAKMLGISTSKLNDLRLKNEILGVRDGSSWKFKLDEIQRYAENKGISLGGAAGGGEDLDFELSSGSINLKDSADDLILKDSSVDLSDALKDSAELSFGSSDISLAGDSGIDEQAEAAAAKKAARSAADLLADQDVAEESGEMASDYEDSDLVLDDSDSSSEVSLEANDSGINLSPTDSGISLEEAPLELGGSDIDSLELPEDDDAIALEEAGDFDAPTELRAEDDFNLTPLEESAEDESSGSQVIALEDSELFTDDSVPTLLSDSDVVEQPALIPEEPAYRDMAPGAVAAGGLIEVAPEVPYARWQIALLACTALVSVLCAMVAFDVARTIWQGSENPPLTKTVMNFFVHLVGMDAK